MDPKLARKPLITRSAVKAWALAHAQDTRPTAGFTRVGKSFLDGADAALRLWIERYIHAHPSTGKTLK